MRASLLLATLALLLAACGGGSQCEDGEVRDGEDCVPYESSDPVPAGDAWQPAPGTSWQWQLSGSVDTGVDVAMYDVDLFDVPASTMADLQDDGRTVICYFSAGSLEDWRPDAAQFPDDAVGKGLDGWAGENWIDVMDPTVRSIMAARLDLAVDKGCDGVEPDNVDGYANKNGLDLTATEQLSYNRFLADEAHARGLSVGLKNDLDQLEELLPWFDWGLNEECASFSECGLLSTFTGAGKAVFHVEYVDDWADAEAMADEVCGVGPDLDTLIKPWDLDARRLACPD